MCALRWYYYCRRFAVVVLFVVVDVASVVAVILCCLCSFFVVVVLSGFCVNSLPNAVESRYNHENLFTIFLYDGQTFSAPSKSAWCKKKRMSRFPNMILTPLGNSRNRCSTVDIPVRSLVLDALLAKLRHYTLYTTKISKDEPMHNSQLRSVRKCTKGNFLFSCNLTNVHLPCTQLSVLMCCLFRLLSFFSLCFGCQSLVDVRVVVAWGW